MWKHTIIITTISKPSGRKPATAKAVEKNWTRKLSASITTAIRATMTKCLLLLFEFANRFWFSFSWDGNDWKPVGDNGKKILGLAPVDQRKILKDLLPRRHLRCAAAVSHLLKNCNQFSINFLFKDVFPKTSHSDHTTTSFKVRVIQYASARRTIIGREPWPHPRDKINCNSNNV